jgi:hypothetical protein
VEKVVEKDPVSATSLISQMGGLFPFVATVFGIFFTINENAKGKGAGNAKKAPAKKATDDDDDSTDGMMSGNVSLDDMLTLDGAMAYGYKKVLPMFGHWIIRYGSVLNLDRWFSMWCHPCAGAIKLTTRFLNLLSVTGVLQTAAIAQSVLRSLMSCSASLVEGCQHAELIF